MKTLMREDNEVRYRLEGWDELEEGEVCYADIISEYCHGSYEFNPHACVKSFFVNPYPLENYYRKDYDHLGHWHVSRHITWMTNEGMILPTKPVGNDEWGFETDFNYGPFYTTLSVIRDTRRKAPEVYKAIRAFLSLRKLGVTYSQCYMYFYFTHTHREGHSHLSTSRIPGANALAGFLGQNAMIHSGTGFREIQTMFPENMYQQASCSRTVSELGDTILRVALGLPVAYNKDRFGRARSKYVEREECNVGEFQILHPCWARIIQSPELLQPLNNKNKFEVVRDMFEESRDYDYTKIQKLIDTLDLLPITRGIFRSPEW